MSKKAEIAVKLKQKTDVIIYGGATGTLFPKCKNLLHGDKIRYELVVEFGDDQEFVDYTSVMDYLFCSLFPQFKAPCLRYYTTGKHPLETFMSSEEADMLDDAMVVAIELLYAAHLKNLRITAPQLHIYMMELSR